MYKDLRFKHIIYYLLQKMCGIFVLLNYEQKYSNDFVRSQFEKGKSRGPDHSVLQKVDCKLSFGFHRLAINGLNSESNQPLVKGDLILICNGEIYNYKELYALMKSADGSPVIPKTQSDCEVILWLYERYGIEQTLQMLDGVFAFALLDQRYQLGESTLYIARDPYGVRPLYSIHQNTKSPAWLNSETTIGFASELKVLSGFARTPERISEAITEVKSVGVRGHNEVTREDLRNAVGLARTPERISEATSVGVRGLSREDLSSKDNEFLNIMNREFTHKIWRYELEKISRENHYQLQFKDWILPDEFIFFTLTDWIEYSGAEICV